jgi:hypothetical protein
MNANSVVDLGEKPETPVDGIMTSQELTLQRERCCEESSSTYPEPFIEEVKTEEDIKQLTSYLDVCFGTF